MIGSVVCLWNTCILPSSSSYAESFFPTSSDFVDWHLLELVKRVTNVDPILDELLHRHAIQEKSYNEIMALPTSEEKMKVLLTGPLDSGGVRGKEILYEILTTTETHLMDYLKMKNVQVSAVQITVLLNTID